MKDCAVGSVSIIYLFTRIVLIFAILSITSRVLSVSTDTAPIVCICIWAAATATVGTPIQLVLISKVENGII